MRTNYGKQRKPTKRRTPYKSGVNSSRRSKRTDGFRDAKHYTQNSHNNTSSILNSLPSISRRSFIAGAAGIAAIAVGGGAYGAHKHSLAQQAAELQAHDPKIVGTAGASLGESSSISVPDSAVFTTDECTFIEDNDSVVELAAHATLPYNTLITYSNDTLATCLLPSESSNPLVEIGVVSLDTGNLHKVVEQAHANNDGFEIFDARASEGGIVWVEADILNGKWRIYSASLTDTFSLKNDTSLIAEGNSEWDTPSIAIKDNYAFWQTSPKKNSSVKDEPSVVMRAPIAGSSDDAVCLLAANGKPPCDISPTKNGIAVSSLVNGTKNTYQIIDIDAEGGEATAHMVLPATMKPTYIGRGLDRFSFAFENIYNTGGGISNLGTYTPATKDTLNEDWFHFARTPLTSPAWSKGWFLVKSTSVVCAVDLENRQYFTIKPETTTQGYGEFLATAGEANRFVTFNNVDYTPLNGERINQCSMRIWNIKG